LKVLIVYDSVYTNTEKIAQAIGSSFPTGTVSIIKAGQTKLTDLAGVGVLIVGSPVQGGRATQSVQKFISSIPSAGLSNIKYTAFDTRISGKEKSVGIKIIVGIFGYAAGRIVESLKNKGGTLLVPPEWFIVNDREGPLKEGEIERAAAWGKKILAGTK
jgi:flavodoxin I